MNNTEDLLIGTMDNHKVYLKASEIILLCSEEVRKENEKFKEELSDCIMSNQLLEKEFDELRDVLSEISLMTIAWGGSKADMKKALQGIDNLCMAVLGGDDE